LINFVLKGRIFFLGKYEIGGLLIGL